MIDGTITKEHLARVLASQSEPRHLPLSTEEDRKAQRMAKFSPQKFLKQVGTGKTSLTCRETRILFSQGDVADAVFYIHTGQVKLTVKSPQGKQAIVALLKPAPFSE